MLKTYTNEHKIVVYIKYNYMILLIIFTFYFKHVYEKESGNYSYI